MLWSELRLIFETSSVTPVFFFFFYLILLFSTVSQSFKVPITPKNVFHLVQSLYGIRKNAAKIFAFG